MVEALNESSLLHMIRTRRMIFSLDDGTYIATHQLHQFGHVMRGKVGILVAWSVSEQFLHFNNSLISTHFPGRGFIKSVDIILSQRAGAIVDIWVLRRAVLRVNEDKCSVRHAFLHEAFAKDEIQFLGNRLRWEAHTFESIAGNIWVPDIAIKL